MAEAWDVLGKQAVADSLIVTCSQRFWVVYYDDQARRLLVLRVTRNTSDVGSLAPLDQVWQNNVALLLRLVADASDANDANAILRNWAQSSQLVRSEATKHFFTHEDASLACFCVDFTWDDARACFVKDHMLWPEDFLKV